MNPTIIVGIVAAVLLAGGVVEGKLLLDAHDKIGEQAVVIRDKQAVIDQKEHDADLSEKLAAYQTAVETALKNVGTKTRQAITDAPSDDSAAAAAIAGVMQLRAGVRPGGPAR